MANKWLGPLCFLGDFNSVCSLEERMRENIDQNSIDSFNTFIIKANLIDQCLSNDPNVILQTDNLDRSDHKPIIWAKKLANWGPKPFRFNNSWLLKKGFVQFCDKLWKDYDVQGWAAFKVAKKMRLLKADIKIWSTSHQDTDEINLKLIDEEIKRLKNWYKVRDLFTFELSQLSNLKGCKKRLSVRIESKRRLHSRFHWLKVGDKNSHFFHIVSRIRHQSSYVAGLLIDNMWVDDLDYVKEHVVAFFEKLFTAPTSMAVHIDINWSTLKLAQVPLSLSSSIEDQFSAQEVFHVIKALTETKLQARMVFHYNFSKRDGTF
ncbi:uncharacterized protein [Rutidosis leptorrhynchoides]|uniref:uncharacterized protein n=1 Tax=Rutidosis leptorrhynchoides TaxID=125765 RepID=UPI003A98EFEF